VEDTWCCLAINFWVIGAENTWRRIAINFWDIGAMVEDLTSLEVWGTLRCVGCLGVQQPKTDIVLLFHFCCVCHGWVKAARQQERRDHGGQPRRWGRWQLEE
jgi:hypothetical protein